jgi:hypothetical protein
VAGVDEAVGLHAAYARRAERHQGLAARLEGGHPFVSSEAHGGADVEVDAVLGGLALRYLLEPQPGAPAVGVHGGRGVVAALLGDVPGVERLVPRLVRRWGTVEPVAEHLVPEAGERGRVGAVERDLDGEGHQRAFLSSVR